MAVAKQRVNRPESRGLDNARRVIDRTSAARETAPLLARKA